MFEDGCTTPVATESWERFHTDLSASISDLADGAFLIVHTERTPEERNATVPEPPDLFQSVWRKIAGTSERNADPFVFFQRVGRHVVCDASGPADLNGPVQLTRAQQAWVVALGWAEPVKDRDRTYWGVAHYRAYFPHDGVPARMSGRKLPPEQEGLDYRDLVDADRAARMAVDTLAGPFAVPSPRRLRVERSAQ